MVLSRKPVMGQTQDPSANFWENLPMLENAKLIDPEKGATGDIAGHSANGLLER